VGKKEAINVGASLFGKMIVDVFNRGIDGKRLGLTATSKWKVESGT
jgi:hypothetical protein